MATKMKISHPRLNRMFAGNKVSDAQFVDERLTMSGEEFADQQVRFSKRLRKQYGDEWIMDVPLVNPLKIREEVAISPLNAAVLCQRACKLLGQGHHRRVAEYIAVTYTIACGLRDDDRQIRLLALDVIDGRTKKALSMEKVKADLLHYLFIYVFFQSKMTTRDRATQYAQGLQPYFDSKMPPAEVEQRLYEHGPDRLRRAAQLRAKRVLDAQEWAESGHPALIPMDEAVAEVAADDAAKNPAPPEDEPTDYGPRGLPPDTEVSGESDADDDTSDDVDDDHLLVDDAEGTETNEDDSDGSDEPNAEGTEVNAEVAGADGSIDGAIINERLQKILLGTMSLATKLAEPGLLQQKQAASLAVVLSVEIVQLQRMIAGR